jgi:hypothetical protein
MKNFIEIAPNGKIGMVCVSFSAQGGIISLGCQCRKSHTKGVLNRMK